MVVALSMLTGGMTHWEWIHRMKQHAVHFARTLLGSACVLAFWKNP